VIRTHSKTKRSAFIVAAGLAAVTALAACSSSSDGGDGGGDGGSGPVTILTNFPVLMAGSFLASIPMIILFVVFQKNMLEGIASSGIKG